MIKKIKRGQKGFTLIEVIIVMAIMGIIAAILLPNFKAMSRKARVNADIRGVQQLQNHVIMYYSNYGTYPDEDMATRDLSGTDFQSEGTFATNFIKNEYMHSRYFGPNGLRLQTANADVIWDHTKEQFFLDTSECDADIQKIVQDIKDNKKTDAQWIN